MPNNLYDISNWTTPRIESLGGLSKLRPNHAARTRPFVAQRAHTHAGNLEDYRCRAQRASV